VREHDQVVRHTQRNVKRWQDGDMRKRWTAAGMLVAEQQFRRIVGYSELAKLVTAIEHRHLTLQSRSDAGRKTRETVTA
jgi:putative transposase